MHSTLFCTPSEAWFVRVNGMVCIEKRSSLVSISGPPPLSLSNRGISKIKTAQVLGTMRHCKDVLHGVACGRQAQCMVISCPRPSRLRYERIYAPPRYTGHSGASGRTIIASPRGDRYNMLSAKLGDRSSLQYSDYASTTQQCFTPPRLLAPSFFRPVSMNCCRNTPSRGQTYSAH